MIICIEGPDRIGKSTCCAHLASRHGYSRMHFGRPEGSTDTERSLYQKGSFTTLFTMAGALRDQRAKVVLDRSHLGELVYGPIYRPNSQVDLGYIHALEAADPGCMTLVMLTHRDPSVLRSRDDGLGFDITRLEDEIAAFAVAFAGSRLRSKHIIDVTDRPVPSMLDELERLLGLPRKSDFGLEPEAVSVRFRHLIPIPGEGSPEFNGA